MNEQLKRKQIIVFSILMKNIENTHISYIIEKYNSVFKSIRPEKYLDSVNKSIFDNIMKQWKQEEK